MCSSDAQFLQTFYFSELLCTAKFWDLTTTVISDCQETMGGFSRSRQKSRLLNLKCLLKIPKSIFPMYTCGVVVNCSDQQLFLQNLLVQCKVIYPKYSKHWPYTVASTVNCGCSKMLNHGLNHGFFLSLFKLIPWPIHWIVCMLAYSNFIFEF